MEAPAIFFHIKGVAKLTHSFDLYKEKPYKLIEFATGESSFRLLSV